MDLISNNDGDVATSDTSQALDRLEEYRNNAGDLLKFLKSIFILLDNPSEVMLQALAEKPISLRRIESDDWKKIDRNLKRLMGTEKKFDTTDYRIIKIIELGLVENMPNFEEWLTMAAIKANTSKECVRSRIAGYKRRNPAWAPELGRMVFFR
jgi:hypothetical protein